MKTKWKRHALYYCSFAPGCIAIRIETHWFGFWPGLALIICIVFGSAYLFDRLLNRWWVER